MLFESVCLCATETAGSRLNRRFPGTPIQGSAVSPSSLCLPALSLWAALTKLCLFDHKVFRACMLHEVNPGTSPFLCFAPSYSVFYFFNFTPATQCSSREEESGCLRRWGCNCTPSDGVKWAGFTGVWRGGGTKKEGEKD